MLSFANLLAFLKQGRYRSLWERALRMRLVLERPELVRLLNFEHMNRELVWHELSEALMFLVPLVDFSAARRARARVAHSKPSLRPLLSAVSLHVSVNRLVSVVSGIVGCEA